MPIRNIKKADPLPSLDNASLAERKELMELLDDLDDLEENIRIDGDSDEIERVGKLREKVNNSEKAKKYLLYR